MRIFFTQVVLTTRSHQPVRAKKKKKKKHANTNKGLIRLIFFNSFSKPLAKYYYPFCNENKHLSEVNISFFLLTIADHGEARNGMKNQWPLKHIKALLATLPDNGKHKKCEETSKGYRGE